MPRDVLRIENLKTWFFTEEGVLKAVDGLSLELERNKTLGLVGESGCGKSVTGLSILNLLPPKAKIVGGEIYYRTRSDDVVRLDRLDPRGSAMRRIRGGEVSMVFQDPMTSLNPVYSIGDQIIEKIMCHERTSRTEARRVAVELLDKVGIANPKQRVTDYPHEFSGGMRQRAMIALALACNPSLLIADEPTTALDVTIKAQVMDLIKTLQNEHEMSMLLITHDMGVVAEMADAVVIMYMGKAVESGGVYDVFAEPRHPYTQKLLKSVPVLGLGREQELSPIRGSTPNPYDLPKGCCFGPRCDHYREQCLEEPPTTILDNGHSVRCWIYSEEG